MNYSLFFRNLNNYESKKIDNRQNSFGNIIVNTFENSTVNSTANSTVKIDKLKKENEKQKKKNEIIEDFYFRDFW
jgi:hypothetical protein